MIWKTTLVFSALCMSFTSVQKANAQCNSRVGGDLPTGSPTSQTGLSSPNAGYLSSQLSLATLYQQRFVQMQDSVYAQGTAIAMQQAARRLANDQLTRPYRLARAEAKRQALADRNAARLSKRHSDSKYTMSNSPTD